MHRVTCLLLHLRKEVSPRNCLWLLFSRFYLLRKRHRQKTARVFHGEGAPRDEMLLVGRRNCNDGQTSSFTISTDYFSLDQEF
jgi:hypothetical protein